jgi:hypothetical protein
MGGEPIFDQARMDGKGRADSRPSLSVHPSAGRRNQQLGCGITSCAGVQAPANPPKQLSKLIIDDRLSKAFCDSVHKLRLPDFPKDMIVMVR